jgi:hypothetical protein
VSDVDRTRDFYADRVGFVVDHDQVVRRAELLLLRERKEFGSLGMDPVLWRRLAAEVSPIRNRLTHMRLV